MPSSASPPAPSWPGTPGAWARAAQPAMWLPLKLAEQFPQGSSDEVRGGQLRDIVTHPGAGPRYPRAIFVQVERLEWPAVHFCSVGSGIRAPGPHQPHGPTTPHLQTAIDDYSRFGLVARATGVLGWQVC